MSKCGSCEHFNLHFHLDEHISTRGQWGECMWPHRMNLDDVSEIEKLEKEGIIKRKRVWKTDSCDHYMDEHCYSSW